MFNNMKINLYYSVYIRTSGEKVLISDEAEHVQSGSYSCIRSWSGLYTVGCLREGKQGTCLGTPFLGAPSRCFARRYSSFLVKN